MAFITRGGMVDIQVTAGQSIVVGSFGAGQTKINTAAANISNLVPLFALNSVVTSGSIYITFATATLVRIEASYASDVEYDFGTQPALTSGPPSCTTGLTARAGGGQALATPLTGNINRITVCATGGDSTLLPFGVVGRRISVFNSGAASCNVFPQTGESIANGAANAAFAVGSTKGATFECVATGLWNVNLSA